MLVDNTFPVPRDTAAWFAGEMEKRLRANDHKPGWRDDYLIDLLDRLLGEQGEIRKILKKPYHFPGSRPDNFSSEQLEEIIKEAADTANFAMMIADQARAALDGRIERAREED